MVEIMKAAGVRCRYHGQRRRAAAAGRSYEIGYLGEFTKYAQHTIETFNSLGVATVVMSCSDGYSFFKNLYPKVDIEMKFEVHAHVGIS